MSVTTKTPGQQEEKRKLPDGWRWIKLGEMCEFLDHRRKPISEAERTKRNEGKRAEDLYPYYGANGQAGWIDDYLFDEPLILLAEDGGAFGSADTAIAYKIEGKAWVNNHAHVLRPRDGIDLDYCLASISIRPDLANLATGNTRPKLNQALAAGIPVPLPPLPKQRRIAGVLRKQMAAVDKARVAAQARLAAVKDLPAAFLRQVFPQPGKPLPDGWRWVRLRDHVAKVGSGLTPLGGYATYVSCGIALIRSQNILMNRFSPHGLAFITPEQDQTMSESRVQLHDILLNITGASIGRVCVVPDEITPANVNQHVSIIRSNGSFDPWFISLFLSTPAFQNQILDTQAGATRQALTKALIEAFEIPLPPLVEQQRIAEVLKEQMAAVEKARASSEAELNTINTLPAGLLRRAFNGEL